MYAITLMQHRIKNFISHRSVRLVQAANGSNYVKAEKPKGKEQGQYFDFVENWSRNAFFKTGYVLTTVAGGLTVALGACQETLLVDAVIIGYWALGYHDITQKSHTILRNFPVLGNIRYVLESLRPEIRQYFVEADDTEKPFDRSHRSIAYQRAKDVRDTNPFGSRRDLYAMGYEWANHSMFPTHLDITRSRILIGGKDCTQKYSASILNISGMSYGALSDAAVTALSKGAQMGNFYHNTGEGGISRFHIEGGGDLVWNVGTGYFGCRNIDGTFNAEKFKENATKPTVKMIEIKLSQGAKPGHGGLLPGPKVTPLIAEARGVKPGEDCHSPPRHSAFQDADGLIHFIKTLRDLSGGKPVGFKLCIGIPEEFTAIVAAMLEHKIYPDFITVDGGEGGTGAAPPEFSNSVGTPLVEALTFVDSILSGAGIRDEIKVIASGKVLTGFSIVRNFALGADVCNSARAMLFALGCIQALKCDTNKCPTGITTQDKELMKGLDVESKSVRVMTYHKKTVEAALDIFGACGLDHPTMITRSHVMKRVSVADGAMSYEDLFPRPTAGALRRGEAPAYLQQVWNSGVAIQEAKRLRIMSSFNVTSDSSFKRVASSSTNGN